ncbi:hypothetical protein WJ32_11380 [Burkholderia ubonensis]|uniref:Uncharacterized protein n=1 Tax=Burkholderia ubonensis TaxID=101571 RepID=A0A103RM15_9BURK|nr:hypothetical protein WJ32_11380 [Burkholderia ubonensis]KVG70153.1 hypothetical protein WJ33_22060 [Burkholderia ubonensis]
MISNWKPYSQVTPTAVSVGCGDDPPDPLERRFGIDEKHRHVDHVVERAAGRAQHRVQVVERAADLRAQLRLGRTVVAAL